METLDCLSELSLVRRLRNSLVDMMLYLKISFVHFFIFLEPSVLSLVNDELLYYKKVQVIQRFVMTI